MVIHQKPAMRLLDDIKVWGKICIMDDLAGVFWPILDMPLNDHLRYVQHYTIIFLFIDMIANFA